MGFRDIENILIYWLARALLNINQNIFSVFNINNNINDRDGWIGCEIFNWINFYICLNFKMKTIFHL